MKVLVGLPAYDEAKNIASIILSIQKLGYDVFVCDDFSNDMTSEISKKLGAIVFRHNSNQGYGGAIQTIFSKARELDVDVLVTIDADGQHDPSDIPKIIEPLIHSSADLVIGSRFLDNETKMPKYRKVGIEALTKLANSVNDLDVTDSQSGFRAYGKNAIKEITPTEDSMGVSSEILIKAANKKLKISEIPIVVSYDGDTSTHNPASHGLSVVGTTIKLISIKHPLLFYGLPGIILIGLGVFFAILTLSSFSENRTIITNQALLSIGSFIIGVVFLVTSIILFSIISVIKEK